MLQNNTGLNAAWYPGLESETKKKRKIKKKKGGGEITGKKLVKSEKSLNLINS